jgi:CubicO group peptidase (beta-lactamase class C family)
MITVAELLHHTSGIPVATPSEDRGLEDYTAYVEPVLG